jgi:hypothetical protein
MRKHYLYYRVCISICDWHSRLIGIWGVVENHLAAGTAKCKSSLKNMISNVKKELKKWKGYLDFDLECQILNTSSKREYHSHQYIYVMFPFWVSTNSSWVVAISDSLCRTICLHYQSSSSSYDNYCIWVERSCLQRVLVNTNKQSLSIITLGPDNFFSLKYKFCQCIFDNFFRAR